MLGSRHPRSSSSSSGSYSTPSRYPTLPSSVLIWHICLEIPFGYSPSSKSYCLSLPALLSPVPPLSPYPALLGSLFSPFTGPIRPVASPPLVFNRHICLGLPSLLPPEVPHGLPSMPSPCSATTDVFVLASKASSSCNICFLEMAMEQHTLKHWNNHGATVTLE